MVAHWSTCSGIGRRETASLQLEAVEGTAYYQAAPPEVRQATPEFKKRPAHPVSTLAGAKSSERVRLVGGTVSGAPRSVTFSEVVVPARV
ncbi:hypothetical protein GCM10018952_01140 [Streptosporangium vulgare]